MSLIWEKNINQAIGNSIRDKRKKKGMEIDELADLLEMSKSSIVQIEKGDQSTPIHNIYRIAEILKIDIFDLLPTMDEYYDLKNSPFDNTTNMLLTKEEKNLILKRLESMKKGNKA
jgi:transcriptional regulator with XRE-family HTH domain